MNIGPLHAGLAIWAVLPAFVLGDGLSEPRPITPAGSRATRAAIAVDARDNAFLAVVLDGKARVLTLGSSFSGETLLWDINIPQEEPSIEVGPMEVAWVALAVGDNELGASGREVFLASNPGGGFGPLLNVSANGVDDRSPRLALDPAGAPVLVWCEGEGEASTVYFYEHPHGPAQAVLGGDHPSLAIDRAGRAHVAFERDGGVFVVDQGAAGFGGPVEVDRAGRGERPEPISLIDAEGRSVVIYVTSGELRLAARSGASFGPPRVLDRGIGAGAALDARIAESGRLAAAYLKEGEVFLIRGDPGKALDPVRVTRTPEGESSPGAREDRGGNLHLTFIRDERVYYSNSAPPPEAEFSADPVGGELPLDVAFRDLSAGDVQTWHWSFGDGQTSSVQHPVHTYEDVGVFPVRLEVIGPGGGSLAVKEALISVSEPSNTMRVADTVVLPGQDGVWAPIIGYHREPIQGFQVAGRFDPSVVVLREITLQTTVIAAYEPEFFSPSISLGEGYFIAGLILDYDTPFDGRKVPPGRDQRLVHLVFDVSPGAQPGESSIELTNGIGPSGLDCIYTVDGISRWPVLTPGTVRVLPAVPPLPRRFVRGDIDRSGRVNMTDVVALVGYQFAGTDTAACRDALDADDSGEIDLSDIIALLSYLFRAGLPPALPFPAPGLDSTDDGLPPCIE